MARKAGLAVLVAIMAAAALGNSYAEEALARPRLENYANYNEFLAAMYNYKKQLELEKRFAESLVIKIQLPETAEKTGGAVSIMPVKSPEMSSAIDVYVPPLVINGPEDLEYAIEAAKHFLHPVYTEKLRYNRTTAQSFPLKPVDVPVLEQAAVSDGLKLGFSTDNELAVAEGLTELTEQKMREATDQDDKEKDIRRHLLDNASQLPVPTGIFIISSDFNPPTISVSNH